MVNSVYDFLSLYTIYYNILSPFSISYASVSRKDISIKLKLSTNIINLVISYSQADFNIDIC